MGEFPLQQFPIHAGREGLSRPQSMFLDGIRDHPGRGAERPVIQVDTLRGNAELLADELPERFVLGLPARSDFLGQRVDQTRPDKC